MGKKILFLLFFVPLLAHALPGYEEPWGKDADLKYPQTKVVAAPAQRSLSVRAAEKVILFRQQILGPISGPRSHFRPSSSNYMKEAMQKYGFFKGFIMGCDRLIRENSDDWVYRKIEENGVLFKHDPVR
ncbi:MAG: membrane protein insertion efficiency factor YidD [Candidatus Melainabacteria bacterium]|nr:membrane protein insertion efficiency factor YidD [Candidatus Melainabacteria bacterium]